MAQNCPEKCDALYTQKFEIYQSDFDNTEHIKTLVPQSWNATASDSGTTKTVAGKGWCSCYINSLNEENKKKKDSSDTSANTYRPGWWKIISSSK